MPYTLKIQQISVKDPETGEYSGVDVLAEQTEQGIIAEIQAEGAAQIALVEQTVTDAQDAIEQIAVDAQSTIEQMTDDVQETVDQIVSDISDTVDEALENAEEINSQIQESIDNFENQKNAIASAIVSMSGLGTDKTLSISGMAADAKATGRMKEIITDIESDVYKEAEDTKTLTAAGKLASRMVDENGIATASSTYYVHGYLLKNIAQFTIRPSALSSGSQYYAFYDAASLVTCDNVANMIGSPVNFPTNNVEITINVPNRNCMFVVSGGSTSPTGTVTKVFTSKLNDIAVDVEMLKNAVSSVEKNSAIQVSADSPGYVYNNGTLNSGATGWHCLYTNKIYCAPGWTFRYKGGTYSGSVNSVLYFNGTTAVSQERYAIGSDVIITVPNGVNSVMFQTASASSNNITLSVERLSPETIESLTDLIKESSDSIDEIDTKLRSFDTDELLNFNTIVPTSTYATNVTGMCFVTKISAGTRLRKIQVYAADNENVVGKVPTLQILEKVEDTDNDYRVVYTQLLSPLVRNDYSYTIVDIYCQNNCIVAIGNVGYIARTTSTNWNAQMSWTSYNLTDINSNGVVTPTIRGDRMVYNIKIYGNSSNKYQETVGKVNELYKIVQVPKPFLDENLYWREYNHNGSGAIWSPKSIPAGKKITKVRFKSTAEGSITIAFADFSRQASISYIFVLKKITADVVVGWNEVEINTTFDRDVNIGFSGLQTLSVDHRDISLTNIDEDYLFSSKTSGYRTTNTLSDVGKWTAGGGNAGASYLLILPFFWFYEDGELYDTNVEIEKLNNTVSLISNNAPLRSTPVLPKYKVLPDTQAGFIGKWYETEVNGENAHVCNPYGGEFYFRTKGTTSVTVDWDMGVYALHSYYSYNIDGGAFTRVSISSPTITLPDDGYHIVRVVCDSLSDNIAGNPAQWSVGGGFVMHGIDPGAGSVVGLVPTKIPLIVHLGDSIAVGCRAFGQPPSGEIESDYHSVIESYSFNCSQSLNAISYMDSYGGTGVRNGGSTANCPTMVEYAAPGILADPIEADLVVLEHGHNDSTASNADFKTAYEVLLTKIRGQYPGAPIVCVIPFNRQKAAVIEEIVPNQQNCYLVDCEEARPSSFYVDGPGHLSAAGGKVVGEYIAKKIREMHLL